MNLTSSRLNGNLTQEHYRSVINQVSEIIFLVDAVTGRLVEANTACQLVLGYAADEVRRLSLSQLLQQGRGESDATVSRILGEGGCSLGERALLRKKGGTVAVDLRAKVISSGAADLICLIGRDFSERKRHESELRHMANHDPLTGLPNRTLFLDRLSQAIFKQERLGKMIAILFLDLDQFKIINDLYGHSVGDLLLREVALRLQEFIRKSDTLARLGGDEFTMLIDGISSPRDIIHVAQKALAVFARPFRFEAGEIFISASIGITLYPADSTTAEGLLKNADTAMYHAKSSGRNNFQFFSRELHDKVSRRLSLELGLRQALEREEFMLQYQPRVEARSGKILGVEALIRWNHPEQGIIDPLSFIWLAEETGMIVPIGEWVLRTACAQNRAWQDAGLPRLKISVNVSCRQFGQHDLAATIRRILRETRLEPGFLELEITESILMSDPAHAIGVLNELKGIGVSISLDDFGTGYSSLLQLKQLPIDFLKVDKDFIAGINRSKSDETLLATIIQMGHCLGIKVIAEGVETAEQKSYLLERQCTEMQGFYFSRPLSAEAMKAYIESTG